MKKHITTQQPTNNCGAACEPILRALPEWFGIEDSLVQYVKDADTMPTMLLKDKEHIIGFVTIKRNFPASAEIHCMAILPNYHRTGAGRFLIDSIEEYLRSDGVKILQVKTISEDRKCGAYEKTRSFYKAVGFIPLEVFPKLWDESNPCLILVKSIC